MITLKVWMECVKYRITEGSKFQWSCFGFNAHALDSWDGEQEGVSSHIVFDTKNQTVYMVEVHDCAEKRSYRYINPDFKTKYIDEFRSRGVNDVAYDDVKFIDLEEENDFLKKCAAIMNYEDYDDRISIPLELTDAEMLEYMLAAHERDMTFNEFVEEALRQAILEFERDPEGMKTKAKEFLNGKSMAK